MADNKNRRVCLVGIGEPSFLPARRHIGPGLRCGHFAGALAEAGLEILVVSLTFGEAQSADLPVPNRLRLRGGSVDYVSLHSNQAESGLLQKVVEEFHPHCLVGVTAYASSFALGVDLAVPLWADLFGDVMAEAQAKAARHESDGVLSRYWHVLPPILERADRFSAVSRAQSDALLGQLGLSGRLTAATAGESLVHIIPCAAEVDRTENRTGRNIRGPVVPTDAFVILWSGSYNTWCDVETLFEGLEGAISGNRKIHFVSTGGAIPGHDEITYSAFQQRVAASPLEGNFHFLGWIDNQELEDLYRSANLGVNVERELYERRLGSENRVVQWMARGLPCVTTALSELGRSLVGDDLGFGCPPGDSKALAELLLDLSLDPERVRSVGVACRDYCAEHFSYAATARALVEWCRSPVWSSDRESRAAFSDRLLSYSVGEMSPPRGASAANLQMDENEGAGRHYLSPYCVFYSEIGNHQIVLLHGLYGSKFTASPELFALLPQFLRGALISEVTAEHAELRGSLDTLVAEKVLLDEPDFRQLEASEFRQRLGPVELAFQRAFNEGGFFPERVEAGDPPPIEKAYRARPQPIPLKIHRRFAPKDFVECLLERQSIRSFSSRPVELADFERFLQLTAKAYAVLEVPNLGKISLRNYPSGGARFPLELYPVIFNVQGLKNGIYHYQPFRHQLVPVNDRPEYREALLRSVRSKMEHLQGEPAALLITTAVFARTCFKYHGIPHHLILQEVGGLYQTMYLVASQLGLAPCAIGAFPELAVDGILQLDSRDESQVGLFLLGRPKSSVDVLQVIDFKVLESSPFSSEGSGRSIELHLTGGIREIIDRRDFHLEETPEGSLRCRVMRGRFWAEFGDCRRQELQQLMSRSLGRPRENS